MKKDNPDQKKFSFLVMLTCSALWDFTDKYQFRNEFGWNRFGGNFSSSRSSVKLFKLEDPSTIDWEKSTFQEDYESQFNGTDCEPDKTHVCTGVIQFTNGNKYNLGCVITLTEIANVLRLSMNEDLDTLIGDAIKNLAP